MYLAKADIAHQDLPQVTERTPEPSRIAAQAAIDAPRRSRSPGRHISSASVQRRVPSQSPNPPSDDHLSPPSQASIPLPTLVEISDADTSAQSVDKKGSKSEQLVSFFTGFLRSSLSGKPDAQCEQRQATDDPLVKHQPTPSLQQQVSQTSRAEPLPEMQALASSTTTRHKPAPARPNPPGFVPLTRPVAPTRALLPSRTVPSTTSNTARPVPRPRTSAFASAALAKLPPPGKGSSSSVKPVRVRTPERARDLASRRKVFEGQPPPPRPISRTIPVVGRTPGKMSKQRAAQREQYDLAAKERRAEMDRRRAETDRKRAAEEDEVYKRKRRETVIRANPVPSMYK